MWKTCFRISYSAGLMSISSLKLVWKHFNFTFIFRRQLCSPLYLQCCTSPFFFNHIFVEYWILGFFSFQHFKDTIPVSSGFHSFYWKVFWQLKTMSFSMVAFKNLSLSLVFRNSIMMCQCVIFLYIYILLGVQLSFCISKFYLSSVL